MGKALLKLVRKRLDVYSAKMSVGSQDKAPSESQASLKASLATCGRVLGILGNTVSKLPSWFRDELLQVRALLTARARFVNLSSCSVLACRWCRMTSLLCCETS